MLRRHVLAACLTLGLTGAGAASPSADAAWEDPFCVTDASARFERLARAFFGRPIRLELVDLAPAANGGTR